jgi:Alkylmercury lyase
MDQFRLLELKPMTSNRCQPGKPARESVPSGPRVEAAPDDVSQTRAAAFKAIWATGRPLTVTVLATILAGRTAAQIRADLDWLVRRGRARLGDGGQVTGVAGLSTTPTRHLLVLADRQRHTWCAIDALGILAAGRFNGQIKSSPPEDTSVVTVVFEAGAPLPTEAVVFIVADDSCASVIDDWCPKVNLFATVADARAWQEATGTDGSIVDVASAATDAARTWRPLFA